MIENVIFHLKTLKFWTGYALVANFVILNYWKTHWNQRF